MGICNFMIYSNTQDCCSAMQANVVSNVHLVYHETSSSCMICFTNQVMPIFIVLIFCCMFRCMRINGMLLYTEAVLTVKSLLYVNTN